MKYKQLKSELKALAIEIRTLKSQRKQHPNGVVPGLWSAQYDARHKHIVYCLMRGRTMEQIENTNREGNAPSQRTIDQLLEQYKEVADEAVCIGG